MFMVTVSDTTAALLPFWASQVPADGSATTPRCRVSCPRSARANAPKITRICFRKAETRAGAAGSSVRA